MGTRSIVHVKDGRKTIVTLYRQFDGYPSGMGDDIKRILNNGEVEILNGYNGSSKIPAHFNGMGCLAAFLIGELKEQKIGNVYIIPTNSSGHGEEYVYTISQKNNQVYMKVQDDWNKTILFNGLLKDFSGDIAEGKTPLEVELS
jgi:hypothetical protein